MKVTAHRLRHTCATQLLNAGCRITSIQKFLGHKKLNTTMIYARAHDQNVADDYYTAMSRVEQRLELVSVPEKLKENIPEDERSQILVLAEKLSEPEMSAEARLVIVAQIRLVLLGGTKCFVTEISALDANRCVQLEHPPPGLAHYNSA